METIQTTSSRDLIVRYGILGGLAAVIYGLLTNILGWNNPNSGMGMVVVSGIISLVIYAGFLVAVVKKHRDENLGGYISFGTAFTTAFLTALIIGALSSVFQVVYINYIDPSFIESMLEYTREMMENMGLSDEQLEEAMERSREGYKPGRFILSALFGSSFFGLITALIVAAVLNKKEPMFQP
jgi:predicted neutral ceramidase superfamily lipid hydrolase